MDETFWDEVLPQGPDYDRARNYLRNARVKDKLDDAISSSITKTLAQINDEIKASLKWQGSTGQNIDAGFIFAMNPDITEAAVADWLAEHEAVYDKRSEDLIVKEVSARSEVEVKRPGMDSETLPIKSNVREILAGIREDAGLQAKLSGRKNWTKYVHGDQDAIKRINEEARYINSIYSNRNVRILKQSGFSNPKQSHYDDTSIAHQEALERHAIKDLNDRGEAYWDGKKMTTWQGAVEAGRMSKEVLEKYGFTKPSIEDYFTIKNGKVSGFTPEGKILANKK